MATTPQRVFVGIKLAGEIADACVRFQAELGEIPGRFIPPEDLHLTLVPPWREEDIQLAKDTLHQSIRHVRPFTLELQKLDYGPNDLNVPRLIWVECAPSQELVGLKKHLMHEFGARETIPFVPHVTLARLRRVLPDDLVPVERPLALSMPVEYITLFRSPERHGVGYEEVDAAHLSPSDMPR